MDSKCCMRTYTGRIARGPKGQKRVLFMEPDKHSLQRQGVRTSMLLVRAWRSGTPATRETAYPSPNPPACSAQIAPSSRGPAAVTAAALRASTDAHTATVQPTATSGANGALRRTALGNVRFSHAPAAMGSSTTCSAAHTRHISLLVVLKPNKRRTFSRY